MSIYYVWVVLLTEESADIITSGLIQKGYEVGPLSSTRSPVTKSEGTGTPASVTLALKLEPPARSYSRTNVLANLRDILSKKAVNYFFCLVSENTGTAWDEGNIFFPEKPQVTGPLPTRVDRISQEGE